MPGQIDVENPNKLTSTSCAPLNGATLFGKKKQEKCMERYCARLFVHFCLCIEGDEKYQENETEVVPVKIMTHVLHALYCFVHLHASARAASSTVQVVGKFWSLHNPQKLHMRQLSYKNYILDFLEDYLREHKHGKI